VPNYLLYQDSVETIAPDEAETEQKIIDVMTQGMEMARQKYGRSVRISHAKAHALLKGELIVEEGLPLELAQGLFAQPGRYEVLVRMAQAPGELLDDSKLSTDRGMSVKILGVKGPKLAGHASDTQDFVFDVGKQFLASGMKEFLQAFKPNAEVAPQLSDSVKGAVSTVARATNAALNAVGANSEKLAFYGHPVVHPASEEYFSQTSYRYGEYVAKLGFFPVSAGLQALKEQPFDPKTPDALRDAMNAYFREHPAEFELRVQLNTGLEDMPIEDAQAEWSETNSQYQRVARLIIPAQAAWDPAKDGYFEDLTFSPAHTLAAHRPLGGINRARMVVYKTLAARRLADNGKAAELPSSLENVPA
jgi:hypothetical protein